MKLSKLEKIDLREQWRNEAVDFTPWLSKQENIELLSEYLNIDLEIISSEEKVGPFRADILCKDIQTDRYVIIENQLEKTDHSHLGQILTYSAGLEASTMIWIANDFTEEHRAAIDWLNEITNDSINFFGVKMELWKIGDNVAPNFNVISKPNNWSKTIKRTIDSGEISDNEQFRLEYWTNLNTYFESKGKQRFKTGYKPSFNHWMNFSIGKSGMHVAVDIIKRNGGFIRISLWFDDDKAKENFDKLYGICGEDSITKLDVTWERMNHAKVCGVCLKKETDITNRELWSEQFEWIRESLDKLYEYFVPIIKKI
jgi:hypothetical protein